MHPLSGPTTVRLLVNLLRCNIHFFVIRFECLRFRRLRAASGGGRFCIALRHGRRIRAIYCGLSAVILQLR